MEAVETLKPRFLVLINDGTSWMSRRREARPFNDWTKRYPGQFYELIGLAAVSQTESAYFWNRDAIAQHLDSPNVRFCVPQRIDSAG